MTAGSMPPASATGTAAFDVERFEWTAPDRLEVAGRWSGVRGMRFVRPTLILRDEGDRRRLLALLEHKPWAAMDGEEWVAAFPWEGEPLEAESAELAVAPSLAVELPAPRLPGAKRRRAKVDKPPRFQRATAHNPELLERARDAAVIERASLERERDTALRERDAAVVALRERDVGDRAAGDELAAAQADADEQRRRADDLAARLEALESASEDADPRRARAEELEARLQELEAARADADELRARAQELEERLRDAEAARADADALRARAQELEERLRDAEAAGGDARALLERARLAEAGRDSGRLALEDARHEAEAHRARADQLLARAQAAEAARDELAREREAIVRHARQALARVEAAEAAAGDMAAERDAVLADRDALVTERATAIAERDAARSGLAADPTQLATLGSAAAPVAAPAPIAPIALTPPARRRRAMAAASAAAWGPRLLALGALIGLIVILALLFHGA